MRYVLTGLLLVGSLLVAGPAQADDLVPPAWRGKPGTAFAQWEFDTPANPIAPDLWSDPSPIKDPFAEPFPGELQMWLDTWGGRQGVWPMSGEIFIFMPNTDIANEYKDIYVQLTWAQQAPNEFPSALVGLTRQGSMPGAGLAMQETSRTPIGPTGEPFGDGQWYHSIFQLRIYPNPTEEWIYLSGAVMVDEVVVDTICVPEPMTLGLLGLGSLALLRGRRSA